MGNCNVETSFRNKRTERTGKVSDTKREKSISSGRSELSPVEKLIQKEITGS